VIVGVLFLSLPYCLRKIHQRRQLVASALKEYDNMMKRKLTEALETTREFEHPEVLISVTNFLTLGKLQSHEELRDRGLLLFHDQLGEISRAPQRVMFFSHRARAAPTLTGSLVIFALRGALAERTCVSPVSRRVDLVD
jgi:hypothetical protein